MTRPIKLTPADINVLIASIVTDQSVVDNREAAGKTRPEHIGDLYARALSGDAVARDTRGKIRKYKPAQILVNLVPEDPRALAEQGAQLKQLATIADKSGVDLYDLMDHIKQEGKVLTGAKNLFTYKTAPNHTPQQDYNTQQDNLFAFFYKAQMTAHKFLRTLSDIAYAHNKSCSKTNSVKRNPD